MTARQSRPPAFLPPSPQPAFLDRLHDFFHAHTLIVALAGVRLLPDDLALLVIEKIGILMGAFLFGQAVQFVRRRLPFRRPDVWATEQKCLAACQPRFVFSYGPSHFPVPDRFRAPA